MKQVTILGLMTFCSLAFSAELKNVDIRKYDCSMATLSTNAGKCEITVLSEGKEITLKASPEVGAPWGNGYGDYNCRPMTKLTLLVDKGEIITVKDFNGDKVSTKFDYSR